MEVAFFAIRNWFEHLPKGSKTFKFRPLRGAKIQMADFSKEIGHLYFMYLQ
jgi:hypothetical protein